MKINEIIVESRQRITEATVGRDLQHVEDVIYIYGPEAALQATKRLEELGSNSKTMTIKFDGSPAVMFGRDEKGQFHFGDKHSKTLNLSAQDIENQVMSRNYAGKGEAGPDHDRKQYAASQSALWKLYEAATPKKFRGFVVGDLLWAGKPRMIGGEYLVAPNTVQYYVDRNSELGQKIGPSQSGVALHFYKANIEATTQHLSPEILQVLGTPEVVVLGPKVVVEVQAKVKSRPLTKLEKEITKNSGIIKTFLAPMPGLSNVAAEVYAYTNSLPENANSQDFLNWVQQKKGQAKFEKIRLKDMAGLDAIFNIMRLFVEVKHDIIEQLEGPGLGGIGIRAVLKTGDTGGEGLVDTGSDTPMKFVNRHKFMSANKMGRQ